MTTEPPAADGRGVSLIDVARLAGVSTQTVSRVTNGSPKVAAGTRDAVLAAMDSLGYRPNSAARALRRGSFRTIGVIVYDLASYGNTRSIDALAEAAAHRGYSIVLNPVRSTSESDISTAFTHLDEKSVDGILVIRDEHIHLENSTQIPSATPVVILDSAAPGDRPAVDADQRGGARQAVEHLLDLGHPTVHMVGGPTTSHSAAEREAEWERLLRAAGRDVPPVVRGDWSAASGYEAGRTLAADPGVSAVFSANDQMAVGLLRALHEAGRRVPDDVSVVGFDDIDESGWLWPPLTTVRQRFDESGRVAVLKLFEAIESGRREGSFESVPTELVVRGSTGPYRPRG